MFSSAIERLNDRRDAVGDAGEDAGFTLIELMVVLLILAILLAIAIPTFLGVTKSANDRAAQSNLNTALVNAKSIFQTNGQSYALAGSTAAASQTSNNNAMVTSLISAEPNLSFVNSTVTSGGSGSAQVAVAVAQDGNGVILAEQAKGTGNCWYIVDNAVIETTATGGTPYAGLTTAGANGSATALGAGTWYGKSTGGTSCAAAPPASTTFQASGFSS